jgi:Transposase
MNDRDIRYLARSIVKDAGSRRAPLHQLKADLEDRIDVSETTIRRRLKEVDQKAHPAVVKPFVSKENAKKRIQWYKERLHWTEEDWARVCWSSECSVEVWGTGVRRVMVWMRLGELFPSAKLQECATERYDLGLPHQLCPAGAKVLQSP